MLFSKFIFRSIKIMYVHSSKFKWYKKLIMKNSSTLLFPGPTSQRQQLTTLPMFSSGSSWCFNYQIIIHADFFWHLVHLGMNHFSFIILGTLCGVFQSEKQCPSVLGEFSHIISWAIFFSPFHLVSLSGTPIS